MGTRGEDFKKADLLEFEGSERYSNGEYDRALDSFAEAASIFGHLRSERSDDEQLEYRFASAVSNTGSALLALGVRESAKNRVWDVATMQSAREAFICAVSLFGKLWATNKRRPAFGNDLAAALNNIGCVISYTNEPEVAEQFFLESLRIRDEVRSSFPYDGTAVDGWRQTAKQLAELYDQLGDSRKAAHAREQVRKIEQSAGGSSGQAG